MQFSDTLEGAPILDNKEDIFFIFQLLTNNFSKKYMHNSLFGQLNELESICLFERKKMCIFLVWNLGSAQLVHPLFFSSPSNHTGYVFFLISLQLNMAYLTDKFRVILRSCRICICRRSYQNVSFSFEHKTACFGGVQTENRCANRVIHTLLRHSSMVLQM